MKIKKKIKIERKQNEINTTNNDLNRDLKYYVVAVVIAIVESSLVTTILTAATCDNDYAPLTINGRENAVVGMWRLRKQQE